MPTATLGRPIGNFILPVRLLEARVPPVIGFLPSRKRYAKDSLRPVIHPLIVMCPQFASGDGIELANIVRPHNHPQIPITAAHDYAVGSFPDFFKPDLDAYTHDDILDLVVFYEFDFCI